MGSFYIIVTIKLLIGFVILLLYLNLSGKKRLSEMTPLNFIGNFIIGGTIGGAIYSNVSIYQYVIVFLLAVIILYVIEYLAKNISFLKEASIGHPIPIIKEGKLLIDVINNPKYNINLLNIARQLRLKEVYSFDQVYYAQIETNGELTVMKDKDHTPNWLLIVNGQIMSYELEELGKSEDWLMEEIKKRKIPELKNIFLAQYYKNQLNFMLQDGTIVK